MLTFGKAASDGVVAVGEDGIVRLVKPLPRCVMCGEPIAVEGNKRADVRKMKACPGECRRAYRTARARAMRNSDPFEAEIAHPTDKRRAISAT